MARSTIAIAVVIGLTVLMVGDASVYGLGILEDFLQGFDSPQAILDRWAAEHLREGVLTAGPGLTVFEVTTGGSVGWSDRTVTAAVPGLTVLEVTTGAGSIRVAGADTNVVRVSYRVRVLAADPADAVAHAEALKIALTADEGRGRLTVNEPEVRPYPVGRVEVDLLIEVPRGLALEVDAAGELTIREAGPARVINFGPTTVEGLEGDLVATVEAQGGRVLLANIGGDVWLNARVPSAVEVRDVGGNLSGLFLGGSLDVSGVGGRVAIESRRCHISLREVDGPVDVTVASGALSFVGPAEDVRIRGSGGHVQILLAPEAGYRVQAGVAGGFFSSDYPLEVTRVNSTDEAKGVIGDGRRLLDILMERGRVEIRRLGGS